VDEAQKDFKESAKVTSAQKHHNKTPFSLDDDLKRDTSKLNGTLNHHEKIDDFKLKGVLKGKPTGIGDNVASVEISGEVQQRMATKAKIPRRLSQHNSIRAQRMVRDFLERARLPHFEAALRELGYLEVNDLVDDFGPQTCPPEFMATLAALGMSPIERNRLIAHARKVFTDRSRRNLTKRQGHRSTHANRTLSTDETATLNPATSRSRGKSVSFEAFTFSEEPQKPPFSPRLPDDDGAVVKESTRLNGRLRGDMSSFDEFADNFEADIVGEWNGDIRSVSIGSVAVGNRSIRSNRGARIRSPESARISEGSFFAAHQTDSNSDMWVKRSMYSTVPPSSPRLATQAAAYLGPRASPSMRTHSPASPHHRRSAGTSRPAKTNPRPMPRPTPGPNPRRSPEPEPENPFVLPFTLEFSSAPLGGFLEGIGFSSPIHGGGSQI
jgi:hypothetical protein